MKKTWLIALLASTAIIYSSPVDARVHHGGASSTPPPPTPCPYSQDGGCALANQNSNYLNASILTTAQQSGQASNLPSHPQPWNLAAVDYPIGYDTTLTLKDPSTNPPTGCSWIAAGTRFGPEILCNNTTSMTINGYDFTSGALSAGAPIALEIGSNPLGTSTVTITNNKMLAGTGIHASPILIGGNAAVIIKYNQIDGGGAGGNPGNGIFPITDNRSASTGTIDVEYNAFPNQGAARVIGGGHGGANRTVKYNFIEGLNPTNNGSHGEFDLYGGQGGPFTVGAVDYEFNFIVWDAVPWVDNTTTFYLSTGAVNGYKVTATTINSNTIVTNSANPFDSRAMISGAAWAGGWASLGSFTYTNNYIDPTGAISCQINGATVNNNTASTVGNTITVTAINPSLGNGIQVGMQIMNSGFTTATITALGTGTGGLGTYTFDGAPQTVVSTSGWSFTPGVTSATVSGNVNLTDGSTITAALPGNGGGTCNNHHT